ncbi:hypothetical protein [Spirosoma endbachense]|uniref:Uncharacterized protein n=1 Tax=Spirosoma endbachense TaxID=2666025 RepID=A0A6P1VPX2_9BACT|nr:hypothetical protein [Spirosoma endbachense]QHV95123.1 hypothetical protein GJR95_08875 [Spirosoma endbachense]
MVNYTLIDEAKGGYQAQFTPQSTGWLPVRRATIRIAPRRLVVFRTRPSWWVKLIN